MCVSKNDNYFEVSITKDGISNYGGRYRDENIAG